jgi:hypothetical protein
VTTIPCVGDTVWAPMFDTASNVLNPAAVVAETVVKLGCGCHRISATRPGPVDGGLSTSVNLLTGCCGLHPCHLVDEPGA